MCTHTSLVLGSFIRWDKPNPSPRSCFYPHPKIKEDTAQGRAGSHFTQRGMCGFSTPCSLSFLLLNMRFGPLAPVWR